MEIKNVNKINNNYPQKVDMNEKTIKENLLDKWKLIGIASIISNGLLASMTMNCEVQAMELSGDVAIIDENVVETGNETDENIVETTNTTYQGGNTGSRYSGGTATGVNESETSGLTIGTLTIVGVMVVAILVGLVELVKNKGKNDKGEQ